MSSAKKTIQAAAALVLFAAAAAVSQLSQGPPTTQASGDTDWRSDGPTDGGRFVGSQACAGCHRGKTASQQKTPMGLALAAPANCDILKSRKELAYRSGSYNYRITRADEGSIYSVSDGLSTLSVPVLYCFGMGEGGQTYVLKYKDKFYESRVSYYRDIRGLELTMGHEPKPPTTLEAAMGREMTMAETRSCFGCHSTNSLEGTTLRLDRLVEGVTCEACHGPGEKHVQAMKSGDYSQTHISNPKRLTAEGILGFCGACHRTWEQVAVMNIRGVINVRFQPYRLTNSKCYDADDRRISCTACHDPHENRSHDAAFYDSKCAACHSAAAKPMPAGSAQSSGRVAPLCPVGKSNCASCHMPKYAIPGSHLVFNDHHIRITRPGDEYPN